MELYTPSSTVPPWHVQRLQIYLLVFTFGRGIILTTFIRNNRQFFFSGMEADRNVKVVGEDVAVL